ncbi:MAG: hypothetical protein M3004_09385, partial [Bacteroidota bacterium]|nr:hypothetical protein [Bacteroidota bacterium]
MNQHLQSILNTIQEDENLSADEKNAIIRSLKDADKELEITAFKLDRTEKVKRTTAILLEETIEELEQKRKAVEAQNRELEIEAALERVRARTMAMQKSDELPETSFLLFQQMKELGETAAQLSIGVIKEEDDFVELSATLHGSALLQTLKIPADEPFVMKKVLKAFREKQKSLVIELEGKELKDYNKWRNNLLKKELVFPEVKWIVHIIFFSKGMLSFSSDKKISEETLDLLKRFAGVFDLTYTRFLDLQKAESQAREAEIQLALERVRGRSLAMHHTSELQEVVSIVAQQLHRINIDINGGVFITINDEVDKDLPLWASAGAADYVQKVVVPFLNRPFFIHLTEAIKRRNNFYIEQLSREEKIQLFEHLMQFAPWNALPVERKRNLFSKEGGLCRSVVISQHTSISMTDHYGRKFNDEENEILIRFGNVLEQSYTRFLDLQKAEAQAREAQIETSLERVRSRTMGMQKSEELKEVIQVVYEQFVHLNINIEHTGFVMDYKARDDYDIWIADPLGVPSQVTVPYFDSVYYNRFNEAKEKGEDFFATNLSFEEKNKFYQKLFEYVPGLSEEAKKFYFSCPALAASTVLLENVCLYIENFSGTPYIDEENAILMRFGKVFQQTYTRFLDLQKAEAQAREAQIETALEKVRSQTMGMHNSEDVGTTAILMFEELEKLGVATNRCGILKFDDAEHMEVWSAGTGVDYAIRGRLDTRSHPMLAAGYRGWKNKDATFFYFLEGQGLTDYYSALKNAPEYPYQMPDTLPSTQCISLFYFSEGALYAFSSEPLSNEAVQVFTRFAGVFALTYRRFLDLQKAEAQAREATIEAGLERVRYKAMAMQSSEDVGSATAVVFNEISLLG